MRRAILLLAVLSGSLYVNAQPIAQRLGKAWDRFVADSQLRAGIASLYVVEASGGKVIFARNERIGLAPASSQKVITAATAYALLGPQFRYTTRFAAAMPVRKDTASALFILGSGDPSLGSWRYERQSMDSVYTRFAKAARATGLRGFSTSLVVRSGWNSEVIPDGWIWQDIGQYYGAGADVFNWHENQFDLPVTPGLKTGDSIKVDLTGVSPYPMAEVLSQATTGAPGSGDNSYFYHDLHNRRLGALPPMLLRGSLGAGKKYTVSGSLPDPALSFFVGLQQALLPAGIELAVGSQTSSVNTDTSHMRVFHTEVSPTLNELSYWFLRKSVNLYGEAFLKTIAFRQKGFGDAGAGVGVVKDFWKERGIDPAELAIRDGSGLSPENRITTHAQVQVLQWARKQSWFADYYNGFPEYNGMKMKSGTISNVKAYCGYHRAKDGSEYIFSFLVNNYNGRESSVVQKMYAVLNELK
jgi:D-alanyl-D-alanine carboxypeptidase/D-alanyl-D-alanine-endopeptidase (penicillin-binding protein 4)